MLPMIILATFGGAVAGAVLGHLKFRNPLAGMLFGAAAGAVLMYALGDSPAKVIAVETPAEFENRVSNSTGPVVVDFYADWCPPCRKLAPTIKELAAEYAGRVKFIKVNVERGREISAFFDVRSIPTVILFLDGQAIYSCTGNRPADHYRRLLDGVAPPK